MPNICSCVGCFSNKPGQRKKAAFRLPKDPDLKERWLKFLNRKDVNDDMKYVYVCDLHFEEKYLNRANVHRIRLNNAMKPIPTIFPHDLQEKNSIFASKPHNS